MLFGLFFTLKMEAVCSFDTSVDFQQFTLHSTPEESTIQDKQYTQKLKCGACSDMSISSCCKRDALDFPPVAAQQSFYQSESDT
jgi:hypothetical protein